MIPPAGQLDWFSPPSLGKCYGFAPGTLIAAINTGELRATNTNLKPGGRPRWRIKLSDFDAFMLRRSNVATQSEKPPRVRRKAGPERVIEFY